MLRLVAEDAAPPRVEEGATLGARGLVFEVGGRRLIDRMDVAIRPGRPRVRRVSRQGMGFSRFTAQSNSGAAWLVEYMVEVGSVFG